MDRSFLRITVICLLLLAPQCLFAGSPQQTLPAASASPAQLFAEGQSALERGDLDRAAKAFRGVLAADPGDPGAYANLGVVYMRRQQWTQALAMLEEAEKRAPSVPGIRLNVGLAHYRQYDFGAAIPAFQSVVRDQPDSLQARYLLGLCYFFVDRDADAARTLEPLWPQESGQMNYLYVLAVSAEKAGLNDLQDRAVARLAEVGQDSAELHLLMGKADVQRQEYDHALAELQRAAELEPKLPFVHYYLGVAYRRANHLEQAKAEFAKDAALEPDVAFNYDQLGAVCTDLQQNEEAERYFREAVRRDPHLATSYYGLAKIGERQGKYPQALEALERAGAIDPQSASVHYLRGRLLMHMDRRPQAQAEFDAAARLQKAASDEVQREVSGEKPPEPDLAKQ
jgi:tetratricopeptide (TPR) repeat protein